MPRVKTSTYLFEGHNSSLNTRQMLQNLRAWAVLCLSIFGDRKTHRYLSWCLPEIDSGSLFHLSLQPSRENILTVILRAVIQTVIASLNSCCTSLHLMSQIYHHLCNSSSSCHSLNKHLQDADSLGSLPNPSLLHCFFFKLKVVIFLSFSFLSGKWHYIWMTNVSIPCLGTSKEKIQSPQSRLE